MNFRSRSVGRTAPLCAVVLTGLLAASLVEARPENLRWTHSLPNDVQRFEARVTPLSGSSSQTFDLGVPAADGDGIYLGSVEAGDVDVRIEIRAFGPSSVASAWTSSQIRLAATGGGGSGGSGGSGSSTVPVSAGTTLPPIGDSVARFDFDENNVGTNVAPWVDTSANYSLNENDGLFDVVQIGSNRAFHTASTQDGIHSHLGGSGNIRSNFSIHGRLAKDEPDSTIGITSYSKYPSVDRYYRLASVDGGSFVVDGRPALSCENNDTGVVPAAGSWYQFELDTVAEGESNLIRAKIWRVGDAEPSAYQVNCWDSSSGRASDGTIGVYAGGPGEKYWDDLEIVLGEVMNPEPPAPPILIQIVPLTN